MHRGNSKDLVEVSVINQGSSLVAQLVKNLPAMQETYIWYLSQEDPLEKEMETHSSIPAWEIPWTEETDGLQSMQLRKSQTWLSD